MDATEKILLDEIRLNRSPSVRYTLFTRDSIIRKSSLGLADIENNIKVSDLTTYNAYSVTKTFTSLGILQLAQQGTLDPDDPVTEYLPDIPYRSGITIRQVLSHSAGIPNPVPLNWIHLTDTASPFDRDQFFKGILARNNRTKSGPDEKYAYSNLGYVLLGQIIEKVTGITYEEYIQNNIIKPLGISERELGFQIRVPANHARGYHKKLSFSNILLGLFIDKSEYMDKAGSKWKPFKSFYVNGPSYGGLIGTADSFTRYIQALLEPDCRLISNDLRKMLFTENRTLDNKPTGMCLAWFKGQLNGNSYYTHAGGGGGYYCELRIYPDLGLGSTIFFNRTGMSDKRFLDRVDKIYLEKSSRSDQ